MSCSDPRRWQPKIALEAGGELPQEERSAVAAHRATCPGCRALAQELAADRRVLADLAADEPRPEALDRVRRAVLAAVREEERRERRIPRRRWVYTVLPAVAAALVALALGLVLWLPRPAAPPESADRVAQGPDEAPGQGPTAAGDPSAPPPTEAPKELTAARPPEPEATAPPIERLAAAGPTHGPVPGAAPDPTEASRPEPSTPLGAVPTAADPAITIQIVSEDPDIVFYWLTDQPQEESDDATV